MKLTLGGDYKVSSVVGFKFLWTGSLTPGFTTNRLSQYQSQQRQTMLVGLILVQRLIFVLLTGGAV